MSIAKTPSAEMTYKGFVQTRTAENLQTIITYQSTEEKLNNMITGANHETSGWYIGMSSTVGYGNLDKISMKQEEGPFWHADLQWNRPLSAGIIITTGNSTKPTESQLTVTMLEMSLKTLPNYAKVWTQWFAVRSDHEGSIPTVSELLQLTGAAFDNNDPTDSDPTLMWLRDNTDKPDPEKDDEGNLLTWSLPYKPTKIGYDYYVVPTYEITEYAKHSSKENAAWSMSTRSGKLKFPQNGDYGLEKRYPAATDAQGRTGRRWLCLGGDISFDGKYYIARCTYRWSNEPTGWDKDLYHQPSQQEGGYDSSYPVPNIFDQAAPNNNNGNIENPILP